MIIKRKHATGRNSSLSEVDRELKFDNDFIKNPELFKEWLPQPYRRIDKVLQEIIEEAWLQIEHKTKKRLDDESRKRPIKQYLSRFPNIEGWTCITTSKDVKGEVLFGIQNESLIAFNLETNEQIDEIAIEMECWSTRAICIKESGHLVIIMSPTGVMALYLLASGKLYSLQQIGDPNLSERKNYVRAYELSKDGEFIAILYQDAHTYSENYIEVYKIPKDSWLQAAEKYQNEPPVSASQQLAENPPTTEISSSTSPQLSFSKLSLHCKVKPLDLSKSIASSSYVQQLQKITDILINTQLIGSGASNTILNVSPDVQNLLTQKYYSIDNKTLTPHEKSPEKSYLNFKFVKSSKFSPFQEPENYSASLVVNWANSHQLAFYSMSKLSKDMESKIEFAMPFASHVKLVQLTDCHELLAVCLKNGNVFLFNLKTSVLSLVYTSLDDNKIERMELMSDKTSAMEHVLVLLTERGNIHVIECFDVHKKTQTVIYHPLYDPPSSEFSFENLICFNDPLMTIVVDRNGHVFTLNLTSKTTEYQLELEGEKISDYSSSILARTSNHVLVLSNSGFVKHLEIKQLVDKSSKDVKATKSDENDLKEFNQNMIERVDQVKAKLKMKWNDFKDSKN